MKALEHVGKHKEIALESLNLPISPPKMDCKFTIVGPGPAKTRALLDHSGSKNSPTRENEFILKDIMNYQLFWSDDISYIFIF